MDCPFCEIIEKNTERIIRQTEHTFTVLSDPRLMPGHLLVIPKRHIQRLSELDEQERVEMLDEVAILEDIILNNVAPGCDISQHFRPFIPQGRLKVDHLHIHLRPRAFEDELYKKVQIYEKEVFQELPADEFQKYKTLFS